MWANNTPQINSRNESNHKIYDILKEEKLSISPSKRTVKHNPLASPVLKERKEKYSELTNTIFDLSTFLNLK